MSQHVVPVRVYLAVFGALLVLTALTTAAAFVDLAAMTGVPAMNDIVMLAIAVTKAVLVVLFFMHVRYSGRLTSLTVLSGVLFFMLLIGITLSDYLTRGLLGIPGK
jgi:cytochrome c oxidase subunit 4